MKRFLLPLLLAFLFLAGCEAKLAVTPFHEITSLPETAAATFRSTPTPITTPTQAITPAATPSPAPISATLGFVGDILMMNAQITGAKTASGYDFSRSFKPMEEVFSSVDFLCGNFECTFAGADAGYTLPRQTPAPATETNPTPKAPNQRFNAPDALAVDLRNAGFDLLSTANNHCLDKGGKALFRTLRVIREAGMLQVGTYEDEADAMTPRIAEVNGIKVGFVAAASYVNSGASLSSDERKFAITLLSDMDAIEAQISACRNAGAEFIVVLVHWGDEHTQSQSKQQENMADALIALGADAIIGTHPHVAQPMEWRVAERNGQTVRVPVAYSLGNFISNMPQKNCDYGVFARLTLTKSPSGQVTCTKLAYLPLLCYRDGVHLVKPCFVDEGGVSAKAFAHVRTVCGAQGISLITRGDFIFDAGEASLD